MALTTWTHKQVVDLLLKYVNGVLTGSRPRVDELAAEHGISDALLLRTLQGSFRLGDVVTIERYRWRNPYTTKDPWTGLWGELVAAGLGERADGGWHATARGRQLSERLTREIRAYLETLRIPPLELRHVTATLTGLAAQLPSWAERASALRRGVLLRDEIRSDVVRLDVAAQELWVVRDDAHIAAWRKSGYEGPALDALSQVWEGKTGLDDVAKALERKQERGDVERALDELVRRGDLTRDGETLALTSQGKKRRDEIERETDRRYFANWPQGEPLSRLGDDLTVVIESLR